VTRRAHVWAAWAAVAGLAACARTPQADESQPLAPSAVPAPFVPPVDHLAPGELAEGDARAFGLVLPRDLQVEAAVMDVVYAGGQIGIHPLAKYFRAHLEGGSLDEGDSSATFERVRIPATPGREFRVHIGRSPNGSRVEISDTTKPPAPDLPDEAARWRAVGLTPEGRPILPTHVD
jgi:hypothetical protein